MVPELVSVLTTAQDSLLLDTALGAVADLFALGLIPDYHTLEELVKEASGWVGLVIIWIYSFLIAFVLPLPSEVVLVPDLHLGLPRAVEIGLIMVASGFGKACGSVFAFHIGQEAKEAGPVVRFLKNSRFNIVEWSEKKTVSLAQDYGYLGLAMALSVPFFPDTLSIYAFSVLEEDYLKFALATFAGSVGRLLVTVLFFSGAFALL
ncbi:YqaA family protein [Haloarchaeobius sp. TZWWS8]|uniref:YqaA family protein n=1 Tax=Haloarchaeobius sp. TZWWS8 TaxID=3446121 RepID=UPI003EBCB804